MARRSRIALTTLTISALAALVSLAPAVHARLATIPAVRIERVQVAGSLARSHATQVRLPIRADMIGASWRGPAVIELSARGVDGRWSRWVELDSSGDGPDPGSPEASRTQGRQVLAVPVWVGDADRVRVRAHERGGGPRDVRLDAINVTGTATSSERRASTFRSSAARVLGAISIASGDAAGRAPRINTRTVWQAQPPRHEATFAPRALGVVVHHTVSANSYSCAQVPALLRGIQRYHMQSNGWNDIGYNYLIDRCGRVWEGRAGGLTVAVVGAHASGFNTGTVGVALIGTHTAARPTSAARTALVRFTSWRMDVAHVAPTGRMSLIARSADKFALGSRVSVRATSGHRDLFPTSCPGALAYRDLASFARTAWRIGGLKVANITFAPKLSDPDRGLLRTVRVRAIANSPAATLSIRLERISDGAVLHSALVGGSVITTDYTAQEAVPIWDVRVVAHAATSTERARGSYSMLGDWGADPGFTVTGAPASSVLHGADPAGTAISLEYSLATAGVLSARLVDPVTGKRVATLFEQKAGVAATPATLELRIPNSITAGTYELRVGMQADTAPGRSEDRFAITLTPPA